MTNSNRTLNALVVNAAMNTTVDGERVSDLMKRLASAPLAYQFGEFADQDIRALTSMYYTLIYRFVSLMPVSDRPLQDAPKVGSLEANDTGAADERSLEREEAIKDTLKGIAYVHRHLLSLDERARKELEEAGNRTPDGGRVRFNFKQRQYKSYLKDFEEVLVDMRSREPAGSRRLVQIDAAESYSLPLVSETAAGSAFMDYMDDAKLDAASLRAAQAIVDTLVDVGEAQTRHAAVMDELNADLVEANALRNMGDRKIARDGVLARMAMARNELNNDINYPVWLLKQRLQPVALLMHTAGSNAISEVINSPEWRAAEAQQRAAHARVLAQEAQAQTLEIEAQMLEMEANKALFLARQQMMSVQKALAKQAKEFNELMHPKADKPVKQAKQAKPAKPAKQVKAEVVKPEFKGANVLSTRGRASSFVPRG